jgi:hypothetical protein
MAREAKTLQAEREAQAKPNDPQTSHNLARVYAFYGKKELALRMAHQSSQAGLQRHRLSAI